ncbi:unnamed protein product [Didymodactylos carnosus]|uniref:ARID domain-containing protein n=1 Tax=Didymodactylos carnosus TaxID=1234261 RepID=A0A8S2H7V5_9BILA|nr:unnamed protein product [Didymodactylos carnosus]CAF3605481.1 unnamed protein product [Didymodactylos carnosus]
MTAADYNAQSQHVYQQQQMNFYGDPRNMANTNGGRSNSQQIMNPIMYNGPQSRLSNMYLQSSAYPMTPGLNSPYNDIDRYTTKDKDPRSSSSSTAATTTLTSSSSTTNITATSNLTNSDQSAMTKEDLGSQNEKNATNDCENRSHSASISSGHNVMSLPQSPSSHQMPNENIQQQQQQQQLSSMGGSGYNQMMPPPSHIKSGQMNYHMPYNQGDPSANMYAVRGASGGQPVGYAPGYMSNPYGAAMVPSNNQPRSATNMTNYRPYMMNMPYTNGPSMQNGLVPTNNSPSQMKQMMSTTPQQQSQTSLRGQNQLSPNRSQRSSSTSNTNNPNSQQTPPPASTPSSSSQQRYMSPNSSYNPYSTLTANHIVNGPYSNTNQKTFVRDNLISAGNNNPNGYPSSAQWPQQGLNSNSFGQSRSESLTPSLASSTGDSDANSSNTLFPGGNPQLHHHHQQQQQPYNTNSALTNGPTNPNMNNSNYPYSTNDNNYLNTFSGDSNNYDSANYNYSMNLYAQSQQQQNLNDTSSFRPPSHAAGVPNEDSTTTGNYHRKLSEAQLAPHAGANMISTSQSNPPFSSASSNNNNNNNGPKSPGAASMSSYQPDDLDSSNSSWSESPQPSTDAKQNRRKLSSGSTQSTPAEVFSRLRELSDEPERHLFVDRLQKLWEEHHVVCRNLPSISKQTIDLYKLYLLVKEQNGFQEVAKNKHWREIASKLNIINSSSAAFNVKQKYVALKLFHYECRYDRNGIDPGPILLELEKTSSKKGVKGPRKQDNGSGSGSGSGSNDMKPMLQQQPTMPLDPYGNVTNNPLAAMRGYCPPQMMPLSMMNPSSNPNNYRPMMMQYGMNAPPSTPQTGIPTSNDMMMNQFIQDPGGGSGVMPSYNEMDMSLYQQQQRQMMPSTNYPKTLPYPNSVHRPSSTQSPMYTNPPSSPYSNTKPPPVQQQQSTNQQDNNNATYNPQSTCPSTQTHYSYPSQTMTSSYPSSTDRLYPSRTTLSPHTSTTQPPSTLSSFPMGGMPVQNPNESYSSVNNNPTNVMNDTTAKKPNDMLEPFTIARDSSSNGLCYFDFIDEPVILTQASNSGRSSPSKCQDPKINKLLMNQLRPSTTALSSQSTTSLSQSVPPSSSSSLITSNISTVNTKPSVSVVAAVAAAAHVHTPTTVPTTMSKDVLFPPDSVEATTIVTKGKRKKLTSKDITPVDPWKLLMSLRGGLLAETTWALDTINVMLCDEQTNTYFRLKQMPGLLQVIYDIYLKCLQQLFDEFRMPSIKTRKVRTSSLDSKTAEQTGVKVNGVPSPNDLNCSSHLTCTTIKKERQRDDILYRVESNYLMKYHRLKSKALLEQTVTYEQIHDYNGNEKKTPLDVLELYDADELSYIRTHFDPLRIDDSYYERLYYSYSKSPNNIVSMEDHSTCISESMNASSITNTGEEQQKSKKLSPSRTKIKGRRHLSSNHVYKPRKKSVSATDQLNEEISTNSSVSDSNNNEFFRRHKRKYDPDEHHANELYAGSCLVNNKVESKITNITSPLYLDSCNQYDESLFYLHSQSYDQICSRCICVSSIIRNLSFISGNDLEYCKSKTLIHLLARLLLLRHGNGSRTTCTSQLSVPHSSSTASSCFAILTVTQSDNCQTNGRRRRHSLSSITKLKQSSSTDNVEGDDEEKFTDISDDHLSERWKTSNFYWLECVQNIRENTLVTLANLAGVIELNIYDNDVLHTLIDGLLHWATCYSGDAIDPLPCQVSSSINTTTNYDNRNYLSAQRLSIEILSKMSVHEMNMDFILATPPFYRIVSLFHVLTDWLIVDDSFYPTAYHPHHHYLMQTNHYQYRQQRGLERQQHTQREFSVVLLNALVKCDTLASSVLAKIPCTISLLINFIEDYEQKTSELMQRFGVDYIARLTQQQQQHQNNPTVDSILFTTVDMLKRCANCLLTIASYNGNVNIMKRYEDRLLNLSISHVIDTNVGKILTEVLHYCTSS